MLDKYRKFVVAFVGLVLLAADAFFDISFGFAPEGVAEVVIGLLVALGVWKVTNAPMPKPPA